MTEFRTNAGLVNCTPFVRTGAGLIECDETIFFGVSGPISSGSVGMALSVAASPAYVSGATGTNHPIPTNATTATVSGGTPPYTHAWSAVAGDFFTIAAPNLATTNFISPPLSAGESATATFIDTVTDALGATADSNSVTATVDRF